MPSQEPIAGKCGALITKWKSRYGEKKYCTRSAGWGTDHIGKGRCRYHAGCSTGPKSSLAYHLKHIHNETYRKKIEEFGNLSDEEQLSTKTALAHAHALLLQCAEVLNSGLEEREDLGIEARFALLDQAKRTVVSLLGRIAQLVAAEKQRKEAMEIHIKLEVVKSLTHVVVKAFEDANRLDSPDERARHFARTIARLSPEGSKSDN